MDPKQLADYIASLDILNNKVTVTSTAVEKLQALISSGNLSEEQIRTVKGYAQSLNKVGSEAKGAGPKIKDLFKSIGLGVDIGDMFKGAGAGKIKNILSESMLDAKDMIASAFKGMESMAKDTTQAFAAIGTLGLAKAKVDAVKFLDTKTGYVALEKQLMEIQKAALQMGMSFGESYSEAAGSVGFFESSMAQTIKTLHATEEELKATRGAMKEAFAAREMFSNIEGLDLRLQGVRSSVNLTNIALGVSKATGMDVSDVAGKMTDMHLRLGSSLKDTALAFGRIRAVAKDSGLTYKTVSDTVIDSAKTLKFYGATVESVSPIFKAFSSSLKGIGKEGLTPELLKDFVGGLQSMQLNTRALLGLSMPGAGSRGILGGALKVEQAMETGEGMGDVIKSISETMKKFGGPKLLTRQEAIESPAAERNFIIQRDIFGQLTKISDPGKQNQMMQILQDIDKNGINASSSAKDKLGELIAAGEQSAKDTTDPLTKADQAYQRTRMLQGTQIIEHLKNLASDLGLRKLLASSDKVIDAVTGSIGDINFEAVGPVLAKLHGEQKDLKTKLGGDLGEKERKITEKQLGRNVSAETRTSVGSQYHRAVLEEVRKSGEEVRKDFIKTGKASSKIRKESFEKASADAIGRKKEINQLLENSKLKGSEKKALTTERRAINKTLSELKNTFLSAGRVDMAGGGDRGAQKYAARKKERSRLVGGSTEASYFSEESRRARAGLSSDSASKQASTTHEITATPVTTGPQEIVGTINVKIEFDHEGHLLTTSQATPLIKGMIRGNAVGAKTE